MALGAGAATAAEPSGGAAPEIQLRESADPQQPQQIEVRGLSAKQLAALRRSGPDAKVLQLYVLQEGQPSSTPLLGSREIESGRLIFQPRFPLVPGLEYLARFAPHALDGFAQEHVLEEKLRVAAPSPRAAGRVTHVYPSAEVLPENQLKFYIHFSVPMSRGEAYQRIRLLSACGKEVQYPFLELGEELWGPHGKRFTLFFDPGRIKRGLKPREELGPALEEGGTYTLVIDGDWPDDRGQPLAEGFRKRFNVTAPDDVQPEPRDWRWKIPQAGTEDPLRIRFEEPLDHAMLQRVLLVVEEQGKRVPGEIAVSDQETLWEFRPDRQWPAGRYILVVDTTLEDRAGNSIGRPFEVDMFRRVQRQLVAQQLELPFEVRAD